MDEHTALADQAHHVRQDLGGGNTSAAMARLTALVAHLDVHVERGDFGIFPVSVVTLGATGWEIVNQAHTRSPSFLLDQPTGASSPA